MPKSPYSPKAVDALLDERKQMLAQIEHQAGQLKNASDILGALLVLHGDAREGGYELKVPKAAITHTLGKATTVIPANDDRDHFTLILS